MMFLLLTTLVSGMSNPIQRRAPEAAGAIPIAGSALVLADAKRLFAPAKAGGIEALDVVTGKEVWTNADAKRLAGASDKIVLAWVSDEKKSRSFQIVAIDAANGKTVSKSDPIEMPEWATTVPTWGRTFRIAARSDGETAIVVWQANAFYSGGARPTPEIEEAARKEVVGVVSINLKTGKTSAIDRKPKPEEFGGLSAKVADYEFQIVEMTPKFKPGGSMLTSVTLTVSKDKTELWKRELAGNPWSPPPP